MKLDTRIPFITLFVRRGYFVAGHLYILVRCSVFYRNLNPSIKRMLSFRGNHSYSSA